VGGAPADRKYIQRGGVTAQLGGGLRVVVSSGRSEVIKLDNEVELADHSNHSRWTNDRLVKRFQFRTNHELVLNYRYLILRRYNDNDNRK